MKRSLVTIISPTYNQERYVAKCAESALAQTYQEWEQIFVDDGSSDATREILAGFRDPRIRLVTLPHGGLGTLKRSYNAALAASGGSLVAILEGDDLWPPDKLATQVRSFEAPDTLLSWGRADLIDDQGTIIGEVATIRERHASLRMTTAEAFHRLTRRNFLVPTVTVMIRREALETIGGFRQTGSSMLVDLPTWLWATAMHEGYVEFLNHRLGLYRLHDSQASQQKRAQMTREHFTVVTTVESELDGAALRRVGWSKAARQRAESRALIAEGELALETGRPREARRAFGRAVRTRGGAADRALAAVGVLSSVIRIDLVRMAFAFRAWMRRPRGDSAGRATRG
jgi:hypothetical protein